jgi:hypothetical protein
MERWREEWEAKQADFLRCIRTFHTMSTVWETMASSSSELGRVAYAKQKSAMYREMEHDAKDSFSKAGYRDLVEHLIDHPEGKILADFVTTEHSDPAYFIQEINSKVRLTAGLQGLFLNSLVLCRIRANNDLHTDSQSPPRYTSIHDRLDSMVWIGFGLMDWFESTVRGMLAQP